MQHPLTSNLLVRGLVDQLSLSTSMEISLLTMFLLRTAISISAASLRSIIFLKQKRNSSLYTQEPMNPVNNSIPKNLDSITLP